MVWRAIAAMALTFLSGEALAQPGAGSPRDGGCPPPADLTTPGVPTPLDLYGPLFRAVQERSLFADSKTFADAAPKRAPAEILRDYCAAPPADDAALRAFVADNFILPDPIVQPLPALSKRGPKLPVRAHIAALWPHLTRPPVDPAPGSSALALPDRYVVPGGRFRELYYWDSYFTMLGLAADGRGDLIEAMLDNFVSLVERFGHVPNGTRSYYVERGQPPFLYLMMGLSDAQDAALLHRRLAALQREHAFWSEPGRGVTMPDGSVLTRYYSRTERPREESWREDVTLGLRTGRAEGPLYQDLRAGAESGWDYSSRWFADGKTLATIDTTNVVPVDLNSLLYGLERAIEAGCRREGDGACAERFAGLAEARRAAIERWLWDAEGARYGDWDAKRAALRPGLTAATAFPLFTGVASVERAATVAQTIEAKLVAPGGLRTTLVDTGEQWDAPNGWAPLQWVAIDGLRRYGRLALADDVAKRFLATAEREYQASGKLVEKYDVETIRPGGGGEYPLQDGFGWTNGVVRALLERHEGK